MSILQKAVGVAGKADCPVSTGLPCTMPVSLLTSPDSIMCDSGSELIGFPDTATDIASSIKDTLFNIKTLNGEQDILNLSCQKTNPIHGTNGIVETKEEDMGKEEGLDISNNPMIVDSKDNAESTMDSMDESNGDEKSLYGPRMKKIQKDVSASICTAENTDDDTTIETFSDFQSAEKADLDKSPVILSNVDNDNSIKSLQSGNLHKGESSDDKLLKEDADESSDRTPVNEEEEWRLLMEVEGEGPRKARPIFTEGDDSTEPAEKDTADGDNVEDCTRLSGRVASPFSDCSSSQSSVKRDQERNQSDSESSNASRKHPLLIGNNMKYSFHGIMKSAVHRASQDSDSARSSPRRDESPQRVHSNHSSPKPCSPKPSSPRPDSSTGPGSVDCKGTDSAIDSSTALDEKNLFERMGLPTDSKNASEDVSESNAGNGKCAVEVEKNLKDIVPDECASGPVYEDERMDTDSPKLKKVDSNSCLSEISTVSVEHPSACEENSQEMLMKDEEAEFKTNTEKVLNEKGDAASQMDGKNVSDVKCVKIKSTKPGTSDSIDLTICESGIDKRKCKDPNLIKSVPKTERMVSGDAVKSDKKSKDSKSNIKTDLVKCEDSKDDLKSDSVKCENSEDADSDSQDRKRSANEDLDEDSVPKRSRLDFVIGKLGSQIGISPENLSCEQMSDSDVEESCKASSDCTENRSEEVTSEDDDSSPARRITEDSLEKLIKEKIKAVLDQQREVLTKQFQAQIEELQASNESWKTQAKELHRRAVELMIHQQRQDRHRAARISGQRRNVGIQVGEERINSLNPQSTSKQTVTSPGCISLLSSPQPSSVNNQMLVQKMAVPTVIQRPVPTPTVKSILNGNRLAQLSAPITQPTTAGTQTPLQTAKVKLSPSPTIQTLVKVIDLTSDDESSSKAASTSISNPPIYRPINSGLPTGIQPGTRILLTSGGTQLMTPSISTATAHPRQPGVQYQYLYAPTNPAIRQGNMVTLVTPRPAIQTTVQPALTVTTPPQLTRPTVSAVVRPSQPNAVVVRAPPPLYSAPISVTKSNVTPSPEINPTSEKKTVEVTSQPDPPKHPAPLPPIPPNQDMAAQLKQLPPKPGLKISRVSQGIVLSWNMATSSLHSDIASYQLFAYQETATPAGISLWKKVGDVKALPLPMACTLTQFQEGNKYHFAVRAVDVHSRVSEFSDPCTIHLVAQSSK